MNKFKIYGAKHPACMSKIQNKTAVAVSFIFYCQKVITVSRTWTDVRTTRVQRARTAPISHRQNKSPATNCTTAVRVQKEQKIVMAFAYVSIPYWLVFHQYILCCTSTYAITQWYVILFGLFVAINECDPANSRHDCDQICVDDTKSFTCTCMDGYRLKSDKKNCTGT